MHRSRAIGDHRSSSSAIDTLRADRLPGLRLPGRRDAGDSTRCRRDAILYEQRLSHTVPSPSRPTSRSSPGCCRQAHGVRDNIGYRLRSPSEPDSLPRAAAGRAATRRAPAVSAYVLRCEHRDRDRASTSTTTRSRSPREPRLGELERAAPATVRRGAGAGSSLAIHQAASSCSSTSTSPTRRYAPPEPLGRAATEAPYDGEVAAADAVGRRSPRASCASAGVYDRAAGRSCSPITARASATTARRSTVFSSTARTLHVPLLVKLPDNAPRGRSRRRAGTACRRRADGRSR